MNEHRTSVTNAHGKGAGGHIVIRGFRAHCSCGLLGDTRDSHAKANRDVREHNMTAPLRDEIAALREAARRVVDEYHKWSEDANDGEFAIWREADFINAIISLRAALAAPGEQA